VRFSVNIPTAATSPVVVCANLRIENEPMTCETELAMAPPDVVDVDVVEIAVVDVPEFCGAVVTVPVTGTISLPGVARRKSFVCCCVVR
jgi:protein involved in polysaccharide export with SLBB domain